VHCDLPIEWEFEVSNQRNDSREIIEWVRDLAAMNVEMVGFNNVGFDYPVVHTLCRMGFAQASDLYDKAMAIIRSQDGDKWQHQVFPSDRIVKQIDLFKIHHFDNKARSTSLKVLEFNMRADNICDLPFPVGTPLNPEQIAVLHRYNMHDVRMTLDFYRQSLEAIRFREELSKKHGKDFMNHSDVKIGKEIFQMELEASGVQCYEYGSKGRQPRQTKREIIHLGQCIPSWIKFRTPEFESIRQQFAGMSITKTKGELKDLSVNVAGLDYYFGTGGIHASVSNRTFDADDEWMIHDIDVTSLYPSIAIECGYFPEHLGPRFVEVYRRLREQRVGYKKGTPENAMLKLALNGVYGASGDAFSIFFDPLFTMKITIGGQLMIAMLVERLLECDQVQIVQCNTDGVTMYMPRRSLLSVQQACDEWEKLTHLSLESVDYRRITIRDVNNYIAVKTNGEVKRKGAYEWDMEWHQNHSALVVAKVAERVLVEDASIYDCLSSWPDIMDFMLRVKVPRGSRLVLHEDGVDKPLENTQRYYVSTEGGQLFKIMPPLAKSPDKWRRIGVESGWNVCPCNDIQDATAPIDFRYYAEEIEKLCLKVL
jgi:hypothetical protein